MSEIARMTEFTVTLRFQYPAYDEMDGIPFTVDAKSKSDACKAARRQADYDGHLGTGKGRYWFKAEVTTP